MGGAHGNEDAIDKIHTRVVNELVAEKKKKKKKKQQKKKKKKSKIDRKRRFKEEDSISETESDDSFDEEFDNVFVETKQKKPGDVANSSTDDQEFLPPSNQEASIPNSNKVFTSSFSRVFFFVG